MTIQSQIDLNRDELLVRVAHGLTNQVNHIRQDDVIIFIPTRHYPEYGFKVGCLYVYTDSNDSGSWHFKGAIELPLKDLTPLEQYPRFTTSTLRCTFIDQAMRVVVALLFELISKDEYGSRIYTYNWVEGEYRAQLPPLIRLYQGKDPFKDPWWEGAEIALSSSGKVLGIKSFTTNQHASGLEESCVIYSEASDPPRWVFGAHLWKDSCHPDGWFETIIIPRLDEIEAIIAIQPTPLT
jgi:hypothetical protein